MNGLKRFAFCLLAVLIVAGSSIVSAATHTLRWEQPAPTMASTFTSAQASAYVFKYCVQGTTSGVPILGATCTTTTAPLVKTCSVPLPSLPAGTQLYLTASDPIDETLESGPSNLATLTVVVPNTPSNLRIALARMWRIPLAASRRFVRP